MDRQVKHAFIVLRVETLTSRLVSQSESVRRAAAEEVRKFSRDEVTVLIQSSDELTTGKWWRAVFWFIPVVLMFAFVPEMVFEGGALYTIIALTLLWLFVWRLYVCRPRYTAGLRMGLTLVDDERVLRPLLRAYLDNELAASTLLARSWRLRLAETFAEDAAAALARILRHIPLETIQDPGCIERGYLRSVLPCCDPQLAMAILAVFQEIGGSKEWAAVKELQRSSLRRPVTEVVAASAECLTAIEFRMSAHNIRGVLLRPSAPDIVAGTLLRPTTGQTADDASELTRAVDISPLDNRSHQE